MTTSPAPLPTVLVRHAADYHERGAMEAPSATWLSKRRRSGGERRLPNQIETLGTAIEEAAGSLLPLLTCPSMPHPVRQFRGGTEGTSLRSRAAHAKPDRAANVLGCLVVASVIEPSARGAKSRGRGAGLG